MRIAVVGSGVSGLVAAYVLDKAHDVTVFEADPRVGGHVHTVDVASRGRTVPVDTGFIVFNDRTYPNFVALLGELGVLSRPGTMSFSVACEQTGLEYNGGSWCGLFAQKRNAVRPRFLAMLRDIARFHRDANDYLATADETQTLADFVARRSYGTWFRERFLFPMAAAIWSADPVQIGSFPARSMLGFLRNHGMLSATGRPIWRTIVGGSRTYVDRMRARMRAKFHVGRRVVAVRRQVDGVDLATQDAPPERFDHVVLATHADQALALLADPSDVERDVLAAVRFRRNDTALHTDVALLPGRRRAWAGWNYRLPSSPSADVTVTYDMNVLQGLAEPDHYLVTLNQTERIDPARVLRRLQYEHPVFDHGAVRAQRRWAEISGVRRTHFCGAWWGHGFHEDGVASGLRVARAFGLGLGAGRGVDSDRLVAP